jgi:putative membrane protein
MIRGTIISVVRGFAMGAADIVPGVSGGTIALVLGIYERLIASVNAGSSALGSVLKGDISGFKRWLRTVDWAFILPLGTGILLAIILLAHIIEELLHTEPILMASLFVGLVAGSIVIAWRMIRQPIRNHVWIALGTGVVVFAALGLRSGTTEESVTQLAEPAVWAFFISGAIAICAMILPGISGSFILVMLGMYGAVLGAVTARDFTSLIVFAIGAVVGLALFSRVLYKALTDHHDIVIAILVGLMAGSLRVLWPWPLGVDSTDLGVPDSDLGLSVVMVVIGFAAMIVIAAIARRVDDGGGELAPSDGVLADDDG